LAITLGDVYRHVCRIVVTMPDGSSERGMGVLLSTPGGAHVLTAYHVVKKAMRPETLAIARSIEDGATIRCHFADAKGQFDLGGAGVLAAGVAARSPTSLMDERRIYTELDDNYDFAILALDSGFAPAAGFHLHATRIVRDKTRCILLGVDGDDAIVEARGEFEPVGDAPDPETQRYAGKVESQAGWSGGPCLIERDGGYDLFGIHQAGYRPAGAADDLPRALVIPLALIVKDVRDAGTGDDFDRDASTRLIFSNFGPAGGVRAPSTADENKVRGDAVQRRKAAAIFSMDRSQVHGAVRDWLLRLPDRSHRSLILISEHDDETPLLYERLTRVTLIDPGRKVQEALKEALSSDSAGASPLWLSELRTADGWSENIEGRMLTLIGEADTIDAGKSLFFYAPIIIAKPRQPGPFAVTPERVKAELEFHAAWNTNMSERFPEGRTLTLFDYTLPDHDAKKEALRAFNETVLPLKLPYLSLTESIPRGVSIREHLRNWQGLISEAYKVDSDHIDKLMGQFSNANSTLGDYRKKLEDHLETWITEAIAHAPDR
jgi:hypothetical protein